MAHTVHGTLVAGVVSTVTLDGDHNDVEVIHRGGVGAADIFFTVDGAVPVIGANDTEVVATVAGARMQVRALKKGPTTVRLISSGATNFTVRGI